MIKVCFTTLLLGCSLAMPVHAQQNRTYDLYQVLQSVVDHYPSVENAIAQVRRASYEADKAQGQLGWVLNGQAGIGREASLFGTATDTLSASGSMIRRLDSGGEVSIDASLSRSDSADSFPGVPNPATSTSVNVNYRHPLARGSDNPVYTEAVQQAELGVQIADANRVALYDQLAEQVLSLYIAALTIDSQKQNLDKAIARSLRRKTYLDERADLGVSEEKDLLQVDAQIKSQTAEKSALDVSWRSIRIQLNRLMGKSADAPLELQENIDTEPELDRARIESRAQEHDPQMGIIEVRLAQAESAIRLARDSDEDQLDLVMFIGNRTQSGDTNPGDASESEVVGGVRLEYQHALDRKSSRAVIDQALLDRDIALNDQRQLKDDIHFEVAGLVEEIESGIRALQAYRSSVRSERAKLDEAEKRYRTGRSDTEQLLNFESQLSIAELSTRLQRIELMRDHHALEILQGDVWERIELAGTGER